MTPPRFTDPAWETLRGEGPNLWNTLGYERVSWDHGRTTIQWLATEAYGFPTRSGHIVQGGLVTALLDSAMGGACWTVLDDDEAFLTADLRVEFLGSARPGLLRASGEVVKRSRRVVFCAASLHDEQGVLLASSRCTQIVLPADGRAGRYDAAAPDESGAPPDDARG